MKAFSIHSTQRQRFPGSRSERATRGPPCRSRFHHPNLGEPPRRPRPKAPRHRRGQPWRRRIQPTAGPSALHGAAEDLAAVLDDREIDRAALLGASMGGVIALHTAISHPDRITRLVIASSSPRLTTHGRRMLELLQDMLLYAPPERAGAALMTLAFAPSFHERFGGFVDDADGSTVPDEADLPGTAAPDRPPPRGVGPREWLPSVEMPSLVLYGDHDPVVAPEETKEIAAAPPQCRARQGPGRRPLGARRRRRDDPRAGDRLLPREQTRAIRDRIE